MIEHASYIAAFVTGLLGGVHCVGMCGGFVGALTLGLPEPVRERTQRLLVFLLAYNVGRIASYALAGGLAGSAGWLATHLGAVHEVRVVLHVSAGVLMVVLGLYLAGWWYGLARIESIGAPIWRRLQPLGRRVLPVSTPARALGAGVLWGWLPCGLVYTVLIWSLASGGAMHGALLMLSFGLGTLPNLMLMGVFAARLARFVRNPVVRAVAGLSIMAFGVYWLVQALLAPRPV